jgi:hypothetical protein
VDQAVPVADHAFFRQRLLHHVVRGLRHRLHVAHAGPQHHQGTQQYETKAAGQADADIQVFHC